MFEYSLATSIPTAVLIVTAAISIYLALVVATRH